MTNKASFESFWIPNKDVVKFVQICLELKLQYIERPIKIEGVFF